MSSGSGISANYAELEGLSSNLNTAMGNLAQIIKQIQGYVDAVAGQSWTGSSAAAFQSVHTNWNTSANQIQSAVGGFAKFITQAQTSFADTDQSLAKGLSQG